jgi:aryl-alcohol dehydrogenase-like predicted oxidoreductase
MRDATTPIDEAVRALDDQVRLGKVLHVGISDSPAWVVAQGTTIAELRGWTPFTALQIPYSVADRTPERELLPMAEALGLALVPWGVIGQGVLTAKPASERRWPEDTVSEQTEALVERLVEIAGAHDATPAQVAIAWMLHPRGLTIVPIVGARTEAQILENLGAVDLELTEDELATLDEAGAPKLGFPRSFLESGNVRNLIYGSTWSKLVVPGRRERPRVAA